MSRSTVTNHSSETSNYVIAVDVPARPASRSGRAARTWPTWPQVPRRPSRCRSTTSTSRWPWEPSRRSRARSDPRRISDRTPERRLRVSLPRCLFRRLGVRRTSFGLAAVLAVSLLGAAAPAQASVVPSPGLPSSSSVSPNHVKLTFSRLTERAESAHPGDVCPGNEPAVRRRACGPDPRVLQGPPALEELSRSPQQGQQLRRRGGHARPRFRAGLRQDAQALGDLHDRQRVAAGVALHGVQRIGVRVRRSTEKVLLTVPHPTYQNHNSGMLTFGRDGFLYLTTGDGGGGGDPFHHAQDRKSLNGKLLRIDARHSCSGKYYCIPATTPTRSRRSIARRSGRTACATPGASRSTRPTGTSGSPMSVRTSTKRSPASLTARRPGTSAGPAARASTSSTPAGARPG